MLETDGHMFEASVESLRRSDTADIAVDIKELDKQVNRAERDVRKKVMTHLIVSGGTDLAHGLALVSVVIDIERIGDYTKNIHDLARRHPARLHAGPLEPLLSEIEAGITQVFRDTSRAFREGDTDQELGTLRSCGGSARRANCMHGTMARRVHVARRRD